MSEFARFLFQLPRAKGIGNVEIDAFISENHEYRSSISRYPIEEGGDISDNIVNDPVSVSIDGIVGVSTSLFTVFQLNRPLNAFNELTRIRENKELVTLVTGLKVYNNMHIQDLRFPRNAQNGGALTINATLVQANIVASQFEVIPNASLGGDESTQLQAQSQVDVSQASSGQTQQGEEDFLAQVALKVDETLPFLAE